MPRKFPTICLDCERVVYLSRFRKGDTTCPFCGSRQLHPAVALWLEIGRLFRDQERRERAFGFFRALLGELEGGARKEVRPHA